MGWRQPEALGARALQDLLLRLRVPQSAPCPLSKSVKGKHEVDLVSHRSGGDTQCRRLVGGLVTAVLKEEDDSSSHRASPTPAPAGTQNDAGRFTLDRAMRSGMKASLSISGWVSMLCWSTLLVGCAGRRPSSADPAPTASLLSTVR